MKLECPYLGDKLRLLDEETGREEVVGRICKCPTNRFRTRNILGVFIVSKSGPRESAAQTEVLHDETTLKVEQIDFLGFTCDAANDIRRQNGCNGNPNRQDVDKAWGTKK